MSDFTARLCEAIERQYRLYEPYRTLCEMEGASLDDIKAMTQAGDLSAIPSIPADWFKRAKGKGLFEKLADLKRPGQWLVSSSTSGDSSYTWRTAVDIQSIADSFARAYQAVPSCKAVAFSPNVDFLTKVGQRFAIDEKPVTFYATVPSRAAEKAFKDMDYMARLNVIRTTWTMAVSRGKGRPVLDLQTNLLVKALQEAEKNNTPLAFASSVLMLYPTLNGLPKDYQLGQNAYFLTGAGGWDGKKGSTQGSSIKKAQYVSDMCKKFGIPEEAASTNFWDIYGTTENGKAQAGSYSWEYEDFVFEVSEDVRLYIIDPVDGQPALKGQQGFPRFISPYGVEGFAGVSIQQSDIVTVVSTQDDGSVRQFTHISRSSGEEGEGGVGCAYEMVEGVRV
jgi:hypothetical protein